MTIFTKHPHEQGVTYTEHWIFAVGIAWRLLRSVLAFSLHAMLPCITIDRQFDLEATSAFLLERNAFIEAAAVANRGLRFPARKSETSGHNETPVLAR